MSKGEHSTIDVLVSGAGPAGVLAALRAADLGARTVLNARSGFGGMARGGWSSGSVRSWWVILLDSFVSPPCATIGRVYLARDDELDRQVAIKVPSPERVLGPDTESKSLRS
jgi:flavin-dependent dehydrogenase